MTSARAEPERVFVEPRWPIALTLGFFIAVSITLRIAVPNRSALGPDWLIPGIEIGLLVLLILADPAHISGRRRWLRRLSIALVVLLAGAALAATVRLIVDLVRGGKVTDSASDLLASGAVIWLGNVLVFSLFYWLLDSGGPLARFRGEHQYPDFAFTQQMSPELATPGWRPVFLDYLHLGFTNATAFSPTDVMPLTHRAKYTMLVQSTVALALFGLIVARAVNAFT